MVNAGTDGVATGQLGLNFSCHLDGSIKEKFFDIGRLLHTCPR